MGKTTIMVETEDGIAHSFEVFTEADINEWKCILWGILAILGFHPDNIRDLFKSGDGDV